MVLKHIPPEEWKFVFTAVQLLLALDLLVTTSRSGRKQVEFYKQKAVITAKRILTSTKKLIELLLYARIPNSSGLFSVLAIYQPINSRKLQKGNDQINRTYIYHIIKQTLQKNKLLKIALSIITNVRTPFFKKHQLILIF